MSDLVEKLQDRGRPQKPHATPGYAWTGELVSDELCLQAANEIESLIARAEKAEAELASIYKEDRPSSYRWMRMCEVFDSLIEAVLGKDYYNMGMDTYACDEYAGEDIARKCSRRAAKKYIKIIRQKAEENDKKLNETQSVVYAHWNKDGTCSDCHGMNPTYKPNKWEGIIPNVPGNFDSLHYCPHCGARMNEKVDKQ
jgi:hypothetical protein